MFVVLFLLGAATAFYAYVKRCYGYWNRRKVPGPEPSFYVGNIGPTLVFTGHLGTMLENWYKKFDKVPYFGYYKLLKPGIVVRGAELVKNVMIKDFASFQANDHNITKKSDPLFAQNPFFLNGDEWQAERKSITPTISPAKIKALFPAMQETCDKLINYLKAFTPTEDIEAADLAILYSIENVAKCGFSLDGNCLLRNEKSIFRVARDNLFKVTSFGILKIFIFTVIKFLPFYPQRLMEILPLPILSGESAEFFRKLVADNKKSRNRDQPSNDIFEAMLKTQDPNDKNDEELTGRAVTLYFEGTETSSVSLSFALYELANNPDIQDRLYAEVCETLERNDGELTFEAFNEMKYLENVLLETLRLHTPILYFTKCCTKSYTLPCIGNNPPVTIQPGTAVLVPVRALHFDPEHYPEPEKFNPDRFNNTEVRNSPVYLPFGSGPRVCIGMRFASAQVRLALFHVVKNFRLSLSPNQKPIVVSPMAVTMQAKDGLLINFDRRHDDASDE